MTTDVDLVELSELLRRRGHVRGHPVAISLFRDAVPAAYEGTAVEPCAIVREAMDLGRHAYVDAEHHACLAGAWQAGFLEPPLEIRTGRYLVTNTPYFTDRAAEIIKGGRNVLPQGTVRAIGAAPLDAVPDGVDIDWMVVVCEPLHAATIAGVRTSIDGVPPHGAAGTSLCGELFALPFHDRNVILTPGDMGGRMFNRVKPSEMFVIIPIEYAAHLFTILGERPDLGGLLEAIKPGYLAERDAKRAARTQKIPWDDDALATLALAPEEIREFAAPTLEAYAAEHAYERITMDVMREQMDSVGVRLEDVMDLAEPSAATPSAAATPSRSAADGALLDPQRARDLPAAPVRAAASVELDATPAQVWAVLIQVAHWESWYGDLRKIQTAGPIVTGSRFSFKTGPTSIDATVDEATEPTRLAFTGTSRGSSATYTFELTPFDGLTRVVLTETMSGVATRTMRPMLQKIADKSLPAWLDALASQIRDIPT